YARLFYRFKSKDLQTFFSQYSWYKPLYDDASIVEHSLTTIQQKNIKFIKDNE
ncbi:MAG: YARHG domain-containing protein, partial [Alphaproteobacteria bacterium]|nr:YARHG domain-containing protein [Alphaproteobacteria bacterium]